MSPNHGSLQEKILIADQFLDSGSAGTMEHLYPATGEVNGIVDLGGAGEIAEAATRATEAAIACDAMGPCRGAILSAECRHRRCQTGRLQMASPPRSKCRNRVSNRATKFAVERVRTYQGREDMTGGDITVTSDAGELQGRFAKFAACSGTKCAGKTSRSRL
jgi:hypothetical protein